MQHVNKFACIFFLNNKNIRYYENTASGEQFDNDWKKKYNNNNRINPKQMCLYIDLQSETSIPDNAYLNKGKCCKFISNLDWQWTSVAASVTADIIRRATVI